MLAEIRKDYFLDKYVIITPGRAKRPRGVKAKTIFSQEKFCPFCPKGIEKKLIIKAYPGFHPVKCRSTAISPEAKLFNGVKKNEPACAGRPWSAMVIKNKYPIITLNNPKAYGQHEVIIETPDHGKELSQLSVKQITNLLNVFKNRTEILGKISKIDYILIFKNEGGKAGASLTHAHCQVFASEILPPDLSEEFTAMRQYQQKHNSCPYCDIIKKEEKSSRRIYADKHIVAFAPYASAYHYETWIFPRRHIDNIIHLSEKETVALAEILKKVLKKIYQLGLSYNLFLHQVVSNKNQHFYLKIQPREAVWGGVELGSGIIINSLAPEKAAAYLRK
ncbi:galactose-1-phosphate uridylyltransferase [Patescibacteria group bacterium]|nr:galactose-1-phosphate uridylyltransferase [Patescibacteria group bacterium]